MGGVMERIDPPRNGEGDRARRGGGGSEALRRPEVYTARKLRRAMSLPEVLLWEQVRGGKLGPKFRRQHPVGPYVADFYCPAARLIVEIDGEAHDRGDRPECDTRRDAYLIAKGFRILRLPAAGVLNDVETATKAILWQVGHPLHQPSAGPPPRPGEDL
jgi:very-short-patch-repair endonuclease